jgi:hypothetical protein
MSFKINIKPKEKQSKVKSPGVHFECSKELKEKVNTLCSHYGYSQKEFFTTVIEQMYKDIKI